jgi:mannan endo-1,6-alpha-mannosidase
LKNNNIEIYGMKFSILMTVLLAAVTLAVPLELDNTTSIHNAQNLVAQGMMDYYNGNNSGETPGMFQEPYYWWESGVAWNALLDYTYYTQNCSIYCDLIKSSMLFQTGPQWDYLPANQSSSEGNDDQGFWGILAMSAAEQNFSAPSAGNPSWAYLAQAVFNTMASRWDTQTCNGGLRWQIYIWNPGYDYKNSVANGCLFHLAARLYRYSGGVKDGNQTLYYWAEKVWNWTTGVGFVDYSPASSDTLAQYYVFDGAYIEVNCTQVHEYEWTYNYGLYMAGCAYLYNTTEDPVWLDRVQEIWNRAQVFFIDNVMYEAACEKEYHCNNDQQCFKGIFARFLGLTMLMAPSTYSIIWPYIEASAQAAASSCSGGYDGHTCGEQWINGGVYDNHIGLGEQINALGIFNALLIHDMPPPLTVTTGATSQPDGSAGTNSTTTADQLVIPLTITTKDRVAAGVITAVVAVLLSLITVCMMF